jgi:hypothetical protein
MEHNFNHQTEIKKPVEPQVKYIPPGKFIDIDERYYQNNGELNHQQEGFGMMGQPLKPYGENANYQPTPLIKQPGGLNESLKVNYGSYIYNQITGWDTAHPN